MRRKKSSKAKLVKRLKFLMSKPSLTEKEREEVKRLVKKIRGEHDGRIESTKLNNDKQDEIIIVDMKPEKSSQNARKIYLGDEELTDLTIDHLVSTTGSYRKGRIANRKN